MSATNGIAIMRSFLTKRTPLVTRGLRVQSGNCDVTLLRHPIVAARESMCVHQATSARSRLVGQQHGELQIGKDVLRRSAQNKVAKPGMAIGTHYQDLCTRVDSSVLKCEAN